MLKGAELRAENSQALSAALGWFAAPVAVAELETVD